MGGECSNSKSSSNKKLSLSPGSAFFEQLSAAAEAAGLKPAKLDAHARTSVASTRHQNLSRVRPKGFSRKGKERAVDPVIYDLTQDEDKPRTIVPTKATTRKPAVIDLTVSSDDDDIGSDSSIVAISSTMQAKKEAQRKKELENDKKRGLVQASLSFSKAPPGSKPSRGAGQTSSSGQPASSPGKKSGSGSSPSKKSLSVARAESYITSQSTIRSSRSISAAAGSSHSPSATFSQTLEDETPSPGLTPTGSQLESFDRSLAGAAKKKSLIFKTAADTEAYRNFGSSSKTETPSKSATLSSFSSVLPSSDRASSPPAPSSTPAIMAARYPGRTATPTVPPPSSTRTSRSASRTTPALSEGAHSSRTSTIAARADLIERDSPRDEDFVPRGTSNKPKSGDDGVPSRVRERPARSRLQPGAYALPSEDTSIHEWPTTRGTTVLTPKRRKREGVQRESSRELNKPKTARGVSSPGKGKSSGVLVDEAAEVTLPHSQSSSARTLRDTPQPGPSSPAKAKQMLDLPPSSPPILTAERSSSPTPQSSSPPRSSRSPLKRKSNRSLPPEKPTKRGSTPPVPEVASLSAAAGVELAATDDVETDKTSKSKSAPEVQSETLVSNISVADDASDSVHLPPSGNVAVAIEPQSLREKSTSPVSGSTWSFGPKENDEDFTEKGTPEPPVVTAPVRKKAQDEEDELDLGEWDDFNWTATDLVEESPVNADSPSTNSHHVSPVENTDGDPHTPSKHTPSANTLITPSRRPHPCTPSKRVLDASPMNSIKKRKLKFEHLDKMLEDKKAKEEEERRAQDEREKEEKKRIDEMMIAEEDEGEEDLAAMLRDMVNRSPRKSAHNIDPETNQSRLSRAEVVRQKREAADIEKATRKARRDAEKRRKEEQRAFEKILKGVDAGNQAEQTWKDLGLDSGDEAAGNGASLTSDSHSTDDSADDDEVLTDEELGMSDEDYDLEGDGLSDIDAVADKYKGTAFAVDESMLRDAKAVEDEDDGILDWDGFWDEKPVLEGDVAEEMAKLQVNDSDPIVEEIKDCIETSDISGLALILASGSLFLVDTKHDDAVCDWLYRCALTARDPQIISMASEVLCRWIETRNSSVLAGSLINQVSSLLSALGAREEIAQLKESSAASAVPRDRESACTIMCRSIQAQVSVGNHIPDDVESFHFIIAVLLLLAIDNTTADALRRLVYSTVQSLLEHCTRIDTAYARAVATQIAKRTKAHGNDVRGAILAVLEETSQESRAVYRWLAMEYLSAGELATVEKMPEAPAVPPVTHILPALQSFHEALRPSSGTEIDWNDMNFRVTCLTAVLSDIGALVDLNPPKMSNDIGIKAMMEKHPVEDLRGLIRLSRDRIPDQSDGSKKVTVKARLHQLLEIVRLLLELAIRQRRKDWNPGKHLKLGGNGQARLAFDPKAPEKI